MGYRKGKAPNRSQNCPWKKKILIHHQVEIEFDRDETFPSSGQDRILWECRVFLNLEFCAFYKFFLHFTIYNCASFWFGRFWRDRWSSSAFPNLEKIRETFRAIPELLGWGKKNPMGIAWFEFPGTEQAEKGRAQEKKELETIQSLSRVREALKSRLESQSSYPGSFSGGRNGKQQPRDKSGRGHVNSGLGQSRGSHQLLLWQIPDPRGNSFPGSRSRAAGMFTGRWMTGWKEAERSKKREG